VQSGHLVVNLALQKDVISETSNYPTESVVVMLTGPPIGRTRNRGSIAGGVRRVFTSPKLPDHIWFSLRFLLVGYWALFSGSGADHWSYIVLGLMMSGTISLLPSIYLHGLDKRNFILPARHCSEESNAATIPPKTSVSLGQSTILKLHGPSIIASVIITDCLLANSNPNKTFMFFHISSIIFLCFI